ncbi:DUF6482 family protein [Thalassotalea agarivorans]|uniref:NADH-quinone reductase n=1 Tax=Thalassotalea agarivorans TaxID=349064 RepID=A0A1I0HPQ3_THASX|nr:DUF6482 family protein [Thalassotalea agarivorans]SET85104.1 hypothetical protein SAMN05660429_02849 [Thalassotalea agarivorans]
MDLFIASLEGNNYIVETGDHNGRTLLKDANHQPMQFNNIAGIKAHFNAAQFNEVWLEQSTPYEEMCGLPSSNEKLRIKLNW